MNCYCCDAEISLARKVKLRRWIDWAPAETDDALNELDEAAEDVRDDLNEAALIAYSEQMTFRWAVTCLACYRFLDNCGLAKIGGHVFNLAAASQRDKAITIDEQKYWLWQQREAQKFGIDL